MTTPKQTVNSQNSHTQKITTTKRKNIPHERCKNNKNFIFVFRLTPLNMPDYAEVAGCSTFKNPTSPLYDSCGAYATTNLVKNANIFTNNFHNNNKNSIYSAPTSCHYNVDDRDGMGGGVGVGGSSSNNGNINNGMGHSAFAYSESNFPTHNKATKMNIIENKMDMINNLNRSSSSASVPMNGYGGGVIGVGGGGGMKCGSVGTIRRNRLPKLGHCDKISFGGSDNGRTTLEQPLFVKSKEDGSWTTVQNSTYHLQGNANGSDNHNLNSKINFSGSNVYGSGGSGYLSSFGKSDNV